LYPRTSTNSLGLCEDRVLDRPASGGKGSKVRVPLFEALGQLGQDEPASG
jgi:hypothetical protein